MERENRLYTRVSYPKFISLFYHKRFIGKFPAMNLSVGGLLLETDEMGLQLNALVEIGFDEVDMWDAIQGLRLPAIVTRIEECCLAVSFETMDKLTENIIIQYINSLNALKAS